MNTFKELIGKPFEDWRKNLVGVAILAVPGINLITSLFVYGYMLVYSNGVQKGWDSLPKWKDWGKLFRLGFKGFVLNLAVVVPSIILLAALYSSLGYSLEAGEVSFAAPDSTIYFLLGLLVLVFTLTLYILPAMQLRYAKNLRLKDAFSLGEVIGMCLNGKYFLTFLGSSLLIFLFSFVLGLLAYFLSATIVLPFLLVAEGEFFGMIVYFKMFSEHARSRI